MGQRILREGGTKVPSNTRKDKFLEQKLAKKPDKANKDNNRETCTDSEEKKTII